MGLQVLHKLVESIPAPVYTGNESKMGTNQILRDSENHVQADIIIFNGGKKHYIRNKWNRSILASGLRLLNPTVNTFNISLTSFLQKPETID